MKSNAVAAVFGICASALLADDVRVPPPQNPTLEQATAFGRLVTEREQRALVAELNEIVASDPQVILYTINPRRDNDWAWEGKKQWVDVIRGYPILGMANIVNPDDRRALLHMLIIGMRESDGTVAACFEPRHALTIVTKTKKIDIVVCFQCSSGQVWGAYGDNEFLTTSAPVATFNKVVAAYKLPDPKR